MTHDFGEDSKPTVYVNDGKSKDNVHKMFSGDPRCETLLDAIMDVLYFRGNSLSIPAIIGVLELAKIAVLEDEK